MSSDAKITIPYHGNDPLILSPVGTSVIGTPLPVDDRLDQLSASVAVLTASLAAIIAAGGQATQKLVIDYDGTDPSVTSDTYGDVTVVNVTATTFRVTSAGDLFTNPIFIVNTYPDVGWVKEDDGNYLFDLPGNYTGAAFTIKFWEE